MRPLLLPVAAALAFLLSACHDHRTPADHILGTWYIDSEFTYTYFNGNPGNASVTIMDPYRLQFDGSGYAYFLQLTRTDTTRFQILDEQHLVMDLNADQYPDSCFVTEREYQRRIEIYGTISYQYLNGNSYELVRRYVLSR